MEALPGLVKLHVLSPPTLPALREELDRARDAREPYHVVHFDGHGVYDPTVGLGGLCFELPEDIGKPEKRRHVVVYTKDSTEHGTGLESLLRDHRIPLVFLDACQTAQAEQASESVASELLKVGVASVVAMSHSVLVETARRFVEAFYDALAAGKRVGDAMLAGQRALKDDTFRGRIFGAGALRLEDWFVPVLFQEKEDPQLFKTAPAKQTVADFRPRSRPASANCRRQPETGFIGRSRELLALQRLLLSPSPPPQRGEGPGVRGPLRRGARPGRRRQDRARRRVRPLAGPLAADAPRRVRLGRDAQPRRRGARCPRPPACGAGLLRRHVRQPGESHPAGRAGAGRAGDAAGGGQHGERPPAALPGGGNAGGPLRGRAPRAGRHPRALRPAQCGRRHAAHLHQPRGAARAVRRRETAAGAAPARPRGCGEAGRAGAERRRRGRRRFASDAAREEIEQLVDAVHCHARTLALLAPALREPRRRGHPRIARRADGGDGANGSPAAGSNRSSPASSFPCAACRPRTGTGRACSACFTAGSDLERARA